MINIFHFTRRLLLVSLIFLNITTVANAANFVWYKNPNSGVAALAPVNWIMPEQLYKENITTTLLRVFSPDAKMHLEVVTFNQVL